MTDVNKLKPGMTFEIFIDTGGFVEAGKYRVVHITPHTIEYEWVSGPGPLYARSRRITKKRLSRLIRSNYDSMGD
jgi:hypothetical protein